MSEMQPIDFGAMKDETEGILSQLPISEEYDLSHRSRSELATIQNSETMDSILGYDNPEHARLHLLTLTNKNASREFKSSHSYANTFVESLERDLKVHPEIRKIIEAALQCGPLVDLGGTGWPHNMVKFAKEFGAETYIDVDEHMIPHQASYSSDNMPPARPHDANMEVSRRINVKPDPELQTLMIADDMLDFVSRMKTGSGNFMVNGIDGTIVKLREYHEALAAEMARATVPGGIICGVNFQAHEALLKTEGLELVLPEPEDRERFGISMVTPVIFRKSTEPQGSGEN